MASPVARETDAAAGSKMPGLEESASPAETGDEEAGDPRLRLLGAFVTRSLRPVPGAWERCAGTAEVERLLQAFLDQGATVEPRPLLFVQPGPGGLAVRPCLDAGPETGPTRAKGLFFLRTRPEPPGSHSLRGAVLCGDLPAMPLEHLAPLLSEVRVGGWPLASGGWQGVRMRGGVRAKKVGRHCRGGRVDGVTVRGRRQGVEFERTWCEVGAQSGREWKGLGARKPKPW